MHTIRIAEDFSTYPAGRYRKDGKFTGERFRDEFLVGPLRAGAEVTVILDGIRSCGSSFLDEAFAGLISREGFAKELIQKKLHIVANEKLLETHARRARKFIEEAKP